MLPLLLGRWVRFLISNAESQNLREVCKLSGMRQYAPPHRCDLGQEWVEGILNLF